MYNHILFFRILSGISNIICDNPTNISIVGESGGCEAIAEILKK